MLQFAVIGRNFVVDDFLHAAALCDDVSLLGVYSRRADTAAAFAEKHGAARTYVSLDALAADPDVDFVYIASPNICHEAQAVTLLRAGKHVLVEKPAAADGASFARMRAAARESGRVLMEAMMPAHMPALTQTRAFLPRIAPVRFASLPYCQYSSRYDKFKNGIIENAFDPTLCNGALMDIGVYCVHLMVALFGQPQAVSGQCLFLPQSIDGCGAITARYSEMLCSVRYSKITDGDLACEIQGENGRITLDRASRPRTAVLTLRDDTTEVFRTDAAVPDMAFELNDFVRCVRGECDPSSFLADTAGTIAVLDTARAQMGVDFSAAHP